jgi:acetyl esterase/lipase
VPRRHALLRIAAAFALPAVLGAWAVGPTPGGGARRIPYGEHPSQFGELSLPTDAEPRGVAVVVHGGFWRQPFGLELGRPLAADLAGAGYAAWNIEYRRVGGDGGWPATFDDVSAALDLLAGPVQEAAGGPLPLDRVVAVGHSAGGHLATWLAARPGLPAGVPGADPAVRLRGVVSQAGVLDLVDAEERGVGAGAATDLLGGGPDEVPDRYALASPIARLPLGVPVVCVHGTADTNVPIRQSERFVAAAGEAARSAGGAHTGSAELVTLPGADHFAVIDPATDAWRACREAADRLLG